MAETIRYGLIGKQDLNLGVGTFEVTLADGRVVVLDKIDLGEIENFTKATLPAASRNGRLARVTDSTRGLWMDMGSQWFPLNGGVVNVQDFGATGDGTTDDAVSIVAALAAADAVSGVVWFPRGTYKDSTANHTYANIRGIVGNHSENTHWSSTDTAGSGVFLTLRGEDIRIQNISIEGPGQTGNSKDGILIEAASGSGPQPGLDWLRSRSHTWGNDALLVNGVVSQINGLSMNEIGGDGLVVKDTGGHINISDFYIRNVTGNGIGFDGGTTHAHLSNGNLEDCDQGIVTGGSSAAPGVLLLTNVHFEGNTTRDIRLGIGTSLFMATGCRFGSTNSRATNVIEHVGGVSSNFQMIFGSNVWIDEAISGASNTEVIKVGSSVTVVWLDQMGPVNNTDQITLDEITLDDVSGEDSSHVMLSGNVGRQQAVTGTGTVTMDMSEGQVKEVFLTGNTTLANPDNVMPGQLYVVMFQQDGTGNRTVTFGTKWQVSDTVSILGTADKFTMTTWVGVRNAILRLLSTEQET